MITSKPPIATIDDYTKPFPPEIQAILQAIRKTIHEAAPKATEGIKYNMPTFRQGIAYVIYYAAWKKHIGMYPVAPGDDKFEQEIAPYRAEKDTVQFQYDQPIPHALITKIIHARLAYLASL